MTNAKAIYTQGGNSKVYAEFTGTAAGAYTTAGRCAATLQDGTASGPMALKSSPPAPARPSSASTRRPPSRRPTSRAASAASDDDYHRLHRPGADHHHHRVGRGGRRPSRRLCRDHKQGGPHPSGLRRPRPSRARCTRCAAARTRPSWTSTTTTAISITPTSGSSPRSTRPPSPTRMVWWPISARPPAANVRTRVDAVKKGTAYMNTDVRHPRV